MLKEKRRCYVFLEHILNRLKIITLIITKKLPRETREQIIERLIEESIKEREIYI